MNRFVYTLAAIAITIASSRDAAAQYQSFDIVVYGGTAGGVAAAVQGARMGKSVVLIEPGRHIGGLTSGGLGATDIGIVGGCVPGNPRRRSSSQAGAAEKCGDKKD